MTLRTRARMIRLGELLARSPLPEFLRFGAVGTVGFACNVVVVYALRAVTGLYVAGLAAYGVAATITWLLNRWWTFPDGGRKPVLRQWMLYLVANAAGFAIYYAVYALAIASIGLCARWPVVAVALGAGLSLLANFSTSQRIVFR